MARAPPTLLAFANTMAPPTSASIKVFNTSAGATVTA